MRIPILLICSASVVACGGRRSPPARPAPEGTSPAAILPQASSPPMEAAPTSAPTASAGSFGFDRAYESCGSLSAHITNADLTAFLDVHVNVEALGLQAGPNEVAVDPRYVTLTITQLVEPHRGEWQCTDVGGGPQGEVTARWRATAGTLRLRLYEAKRPPQPYEGPFERVDIELVDVTFVSETGREVEVSLALAGFGIGWLPG